MNLNTSELNVLLSNITNQLKFCKCKLSTNDSNYRKLVSFHKPETHNNNLPKGELSKEIANSHPDIFNKIKLKISCPNCNNEVLQQEKEIIKKMQNAFLQNLLKTGIDFSSLLLPKTLDDLNDDENDFFKIKCHPKYMKRNAKGETPLHVAAKKKDLHSVKIMLKNEVNPNVQDNAGWTPLHEAVFDDNFEIALELLKVGAIVNVPGDDFVTPLHIATQRSNFTMVQLLLKFGADTMARDSNNRNPKFYATDPQIISLLNDYSNFVDIIKMAEIFEKRAAARPVLVYVTPNNGKCIISGYEVENELNIQFSKVLDKTVTHVVALDAINNICSSSLDILKAILFGCIIVNVKWLKTCIKRKEIVNFSEYEVNGSMEHPTINGSRKARNNFLRLNPPLFTGCHIFLMKLSRLDDIKKLVIASGAKLLNREPNPEHAPTNYCVYHCPPGHSLENTSTLILYDKERQPNLKYNMKHIKTLPVDWFLDCILTFTIKEPFETIN